MIVRFEKLCSNLLIFQKKIQVVGKNAKLLSFRKKNNKNLFFQKRFFLEKKNCKNLRILAIFFVASDVIKKLYLRAEFRNKLKKYFKSHDIETMIQNFEQKYRFFHNFHSKFQNTIKFDKVTLV